MSWLTSVMKHVDYLRGRYEPFAVRDEADRTAALAVLEEVRRYELNRVQGRSVLESSAFVDAEVDSKLYAVRDTQDGRVVGCVRSTPVAQIATLPDSRREYELDKFPPELIERSEVITRLAILKDHRKTAASPALFRKLYDDALDEGRLLLGLLSCEPGLYAGYLRIGFRPVGAVHQGASGGFRIPMVFVNHDLEHLKQVRSPLARQLARRSGPHPQEGVLWYRALEAREGNIHPGVAFYMDDGKQEVHAPLTRGLSEDGRADLLRNAMEVDCHPGDVVVAAGDGGRSMGFVVRGLVQVETQQRVVALLGEGELFGEMAVALEKPRTANVVAASDDTRVLMLSQSCLARLRDPADVARAWRNLARVLATRVQRRNG